LADKAYASKANRDALRGRHRDGIMRMEPVIDPSSSTPAGFGKTRGQADIQTPLEGLSNAYATMKYRPIVRTGQNRRPAGAGGNRTEPAVAANRITLNPQTPDHQNRFARCKASGPDRIAKSTLPPNITLLRRGLSWSKRPGY